MRITIAVPAAYVDDANHLAMALGYSVSDGKTYGDAIWYDDQGNAYACASLPVGGGFVTAATSPLQRPSWDVGQAIDMDAATSAQSKVVFWQSSEDNKDPPEASPDAIVAAVGNNGPEILNAMGVFCSQDDLT